MDFSVGGGDFASFCLDIKENAHSLLIVDIVDLSSSVSDALKTEIKRDEVTIYEKAG